MGSGRQHFEPFAHLVDVTDDSALIAWGGFYLAEGDDGWFVVDDDDLPDGRTRSGTIGAQSASYGRASVEVFDGGSLAGSATTDDRNHVWVEGLQPDHEYRYRITVDGAEWASGERWDWELGDAGGTLAQCGRGYDFRFRTHPRVDDYVPTAFVAVGDYGVGIVNGDDGRHQVAVARAMERLADVHDVRAIVSLGDNIYHGPEGPLAQSGDEDDDWYFTFYAPYRYLIDHVPLYPTAGNHDGADEEANDDRAQLADNFHLETRLRRLAADGRASRDPGLYYRVAVGGLVELICVDTTWGGEVGHHYFDDDQHRGWLDETFPADGGGEPWRWRIPFSHHPAWCAGPHHEGMVEQFDGLVPRYERAGVRLVLAGHEHNFQHGRHGDLHHVIAGAGAKLDRRRPEQWVTAGTLAWAAEAHCLLVQAEHDHIRVTPYGEIDADGDPVPLVAQDSNGDAVPAGFTVSRNT
jgi:tartrate-resistant acid phosphatase type 5